MATLTVSSKGQIVLPANVRRRLGMGAGAKIELVEEADGLRLKVVRTVPQMDVTNLVGMIKARRCGIARRLEDFDPAATLRRRSKP